MTNFPTQLDLFTNPGASDAMNNPAVHHDVQHANLNDAVKAVQEKVGIDGSADTESLDYRVAQLEAGGGGGGSDLQTVHGLTDAPAGAPANVTKAAIYFGPNGTFYSWKPNASAWVAVVSF